MGLIRWIIIIVLFFLIYQVLKGLISPNRPRFTTPSTSPEESSGMDRTEDLVQDPETGVFFPRSEGVASLVNGRVLYFQNSETRDRYLASHKADDKGGTA
jgi:hypothetical protein